MEPGLDEFLSPRFPSMVRLGLENGFGPQKWANRYHLRYPSQTKLEILMKAVVTELRQECEPVMYERETETANERRKQIKKSERWRERRLEEN